MSYLGSWKIDDYLTFCCNTHDPDTGVATDADAVPTYRVYEDETGTPILTGSTALLDAANTAGFYSEQIQLTAANGFEKGKCYTVYVTATVDGDVGTMHHNFQLEAEVDANTVSATADVNVTQISGDSGAADNAEAFFDGTGYAGTNNVIPTVTTLTGHTDQTGDNYARLGAPAGASVSADIADVPTVAEFEARTLVAASYFDPGADAVANVTLVATTTTNTDMAGTDSAALASVCTETRLAELDAANLPTGIADVPTVAEFDARTQPTANYFDPANDAVANVTLVATTTTNTDMVGTDSAALASVCTETRLAELDAANLPMDIAALPTTAEVKTEVDTALSDIHLDHLFATDYDPASKPGAATALLNELFEDDSGVSRLTENALEQAPSGTGGDATEAKQDTIITHLTDVKGATFADTDSLEAIRDRGDAAWVTGAGGTAGSGAITFIYTLTSSVDSAPIAQADVWVTTDEAGTNVIASGTTSDTGTVTFYLDAGTYYVFRAKSGWVFENPDTEVVAA